MVGDTGHDQLFGAAGNDTLYAGEGLDYLDGGSGDDLIMAVEDDELLLPLLFDIPGPFIGTGSLYEDQIHAGSGKDVIFAGASDIVYADGGDDVIHLVNYTPAPGVGPGWAVGDAGNDVILGSDMEDWIFTGSYNYFWGQDKWNPLVEIFLGGFNDVVNSGGGDDWITTMNYCNAKINTGDGKDDVFTVGLWDVIAMGDGADQLTLYGGACTADLGDGNDVLRMTRAAYDNPNVSQIILGAGTDGVYFATNEWFTNGDQQSLARAPWILDFDITADQVTQIDVTNLDDATQSLNADYIKTVDIFGGSALIYDDPLDNSLDFCFGRFKGVSAADLQTNIDTYTFFA
jgi:Ca2+-binding RTX toxin-like protein